MNPDAPTKSRELRGSVVMQECFRDITQHILCVTLRSFIPGAQGTPRPCAGSKCRTIWRCVLSRVCTVTLIAPLPPAVAPLPVSLQSARQLAGILHANSAAPLLMKSGRGVFPLKPPPIPPMLVPPSIPKGGLRQIVIGLRVGQTLRHFARRSGLASSEKLPHCFRQCLAHFYQLTDSYQPC